MFYCLFALYFIGEHYPKLRIPICYVHYFLVQFIQNFLNISYCLSKPLYYCSVLRSEAEHVPIYSEHSWVLSLLPRTSFIIHCLWNSSRLHTRGHHEFEYYHSVIGFDRVAHVY